MKLIYFVLIFFCVSNVGTAATYYTITGSGNLTWNGTNNIWTTSPSSGVGGGVQPGAGDNIIINNGRNVTVTFSTPIVGTITVTGTGRILAISGAGSLNYTSITINTGATLSASAGLNGGAITNNGTFTANSNSIAVGAIDNSGTLTVSSGSSISCGTITNSGTLNFNGTNITVAGSITNTGVLAVYEGGTITLTGNFNDNGGFTDILGVSAITFNGSSQTINSTQASSSTNFTIVNVNSGTVNFASVTNASININTLNIVNGANAVVSNGAHLNLTGPLLLNGTATFDADGAGGTGVFTLISVDQYAVGSIGRLLTPANFTGNVTIQRYIHGKAGGLGDYRYLSMPIINGSLGFWKAAFGVTGNFSDKSTTAEFPNVIDAGSYKPSVFEYNPSTQAYVAVDGTGGTVASKTLDSRKAYVAYNFTDDEDYEGRVASYTGAIEKGDVPIAVSSTTNAFSLVPNPYPCTVNWDRVWASNSSVVNASIYWRTANNTFSSYVGLPVPPMDPNEATGGEIAVGQAFWVRSAGGGSTLTFSETHKTGAQGTFLREETTEEVINYFRLSLASATQKDHAAIRFHANATDETDGAFDAPKRYNGSYNATTKLYSYINLSTFNTTATKDFVINSVGELSSCSKTMGIRVADVTPGNYTFQFTDLAKLQLDYTITLVDLFLNKEKIVTDNTEYSFAVTADAKSLGSERFQLRFEKPLVVPALSIQDKNLISSIEENNQWYKDGVAIQGANAPTYAVSASGVYTVKSVNGACENNASTLVMAVANDAQVIGCSKTLGVKVAGVTQGNYTLKFNGLSGVTGYTTRLVDKFLNTEKTVNDNAEYPFSVTSDANSFGDTRFEIHFSKIVTSPVVTVQGQTLVSSVETGNQWYKDGQLVAGATASTYDVIASGTYTVKNTTGGCETAAENITMTITALPEIANAESAVYPNPTTGKIFINLPNDKDVTLTGVYLYDVKGSVVVDSEKTSTLLKPGEKSIDITNSHGGVYILNLVSGREIKSIRVIKK